MESSTDSNVYKVDRDNFEELFDVVVRDIRAATFFGIDLEFTGLRNDERHRDSLFDNGEDRYHKLRLGLEGVAIHQFGLALFTMDSSRHYDVKCYNFYLCPRSCPGHDPVITFLSSSVLFGRVNDPQFHHSFEKGISYVDADTERRLKVELSPEQLKQTVGFTRLFREILESKKPFVGHNCFTDLLLMYSSFVEPLSEKYSEGKKCLKRAFREVYDTKHVSYKIKSCVKDWKDLNVVVANNGLETLHSALIKFGGTTVVFPVIGTIPSFEGPNASKPHEAGYDAYMTASIFLRCACLYSAFLRTSKDDLSARRYELMSFREITFAVRCFVNRLNVIRSQVQCVCLDGPDVSAGPERPGLLVATPIGNNGLGGLSGAMGKFGSADVRLLGEGKALVAASSDFAAKNILAKLGQSKRFKVRKYSPLLDDPLWSKLGLIFGSFCLFTAVVLAVPCNER